ncbi:hypothetical protein GCM10028822_22910 [Hymenobacter terrigena]
MKTLLLAGLVLLFGFSPVFAQSSPDQHLTTASRADSVAVLRHLFHHCRKTEQFSTALFVFLLGTNASHINSGEGLRKPIAALGISASSAGLAMSIIDWVRFNHAHEEAVVHRLEQGQPVPRYVQRRFAPAWAGELARHQSAGSR